MRSVSSSSGRGQRRQVGGVQGHRRQCGPPPTGFGPLGGRTYPRRSCCSDSTSGGWTATCAVGCPDRRPRSSRPSTRCGRSSPTCGPGATSRSASSPSASTAPRSTTLRVPDDEVRAALDADRPRRCGPRSRSPTRNIPAYHEAQRHPDAVHHNGGDRRCASSSGPSTGRAATCPAALAPLVSTVLMTAVPAQVAGVPEVVLVTSPQPRRHAWRPAILAARPRSPASTRCTAVGGPRPIGALAYGTESIRPVDVIVGPGQRLRRPGQARGRSAGLVGVPVAFAGPSEVVVVADATAPVGLRRHRRRAAGRARPRRPGLAHHLGRGRGRRASTRRRRRDRAARSPRREHLEATLAEGGYVVLVDGPEQALAVANAIAPEHLELIVDDPEALAAAGAPRRRRVLRAAARRRRSATTSPGPTTCCPPSARPASPAPCASTTSSSTCTSCPLDEAGLAAVGAARRSRWPTYEGLDAHAESDPPARRATGMTDRARVTTSRSMEGYHSPQVDVRRPAQHQRVARAAARRRSRDALAAELAARRLAPLPRPRATARCARRIAARHGVDPAQVFAANGSNEVLQTLLLAYGGPGPHGRRRSSRPTRCTATSPASPAPAWPTGERRRRLRARPRRGAARRWPRPSRPIAFLCSPNNPTGHGRDRGRRCARCSTCAPGPAGRRRGLRPVRAVVGARARRRRRARSSSPAPSRRPGRWRPPGSATSIGPPWLVAELDKVVLPYHLDAAQADRRPPRARLRRRDGRRASPRSSRSAAGSWPRLAELPVDVWPSGANFVLFRPDDASTARAVWQRPARPVACSSATARRGRASTAACGSPSAPPTRTTPSSPPSRRSSA